MEHSVSVLRTRAEMINTFVTHLGGGGVQEMSSKYQMFKMIHGEELNILYQRQESSKPSEHLNLSVCWDQMPI